MGCCGRRRESLESNLRSAASVNALKNRSQPQRRAVSFPGPTGGESVHETPQPINPGFTRDIALRFTETSRIIVEGSVTHRRYEFSGSDPVKLVDSRDAVTLVRTRFFVRG